MPQKRMFRKKKTSKVPESVKSYVKQTINRKVETKQKNVAIATGAPVGGGGLAYAGGATTGGFISNEVLNTLNIIQGTGRSDRIGNRIRPRRLQIRGTINSQQSSSNLEGFDLHMFVYKQIQNQSTIAPSGLMNNGNTSVDFDGTQLVSMYPFNKSKFKIFKHRVFRMGTAASVTSATTTTDGANNLNATYRRFNSTIKLPKVLKYNNVSGDPTNEMLYVGFAYVNMNGVVDAFAINRAKINCEALITYEDA